MNVRRALALAVIAFTSATLAGCSHDITSPAATSKSVAPDLVCGEQLTTSVTLTGDGFTPMPEKTLESKEELLLPQVSVTRTEDLTGAGAGLPPFSIPDDPANPSKSQLHWTSESQMSFTVTPDLMLQPGLYDVVVTNPDQKHKATFGGGLAVVPRPKLAATQPDILCDAEDDQTVTLSGDGLLQVGSDMPTVMIGTGSTATSFKIQKVDSCTPVPGTHAEGMVQSCKSASFVIPKGTLMPGTYPLTLTNPDPAGCHSTDTINITVVPPPEVATIVADLICDAQGDQSMTLSGSSFLELGTTLPTITLGTMTFTPTMAGGCTPVTGTFVEGAAQECTSLSFTIPKGALMPGDYPVVVTNPMPADCHSLESVNLHVAPPPTVSGANPLSVCDAEGDDQVTVDGMGFLEVGSTLPTVKIGNQTFTAMSATGCTTVTGMFTEGMVQECTGLVITVPKGTFTPGMYEITVTNPMPADCSSTEMVNLDVIPPPTVSTVTPATLCAGGGTLTIDGMGFTSNASVSLQATGQTTIMAANSMVDAAGDQIVSTFGGPLKVGNKYDVVVDDADGCIDQPPHQTVTVVTGPIAFFADPDLVYNGINTRVTIYLTTLMGTATVTLTPAGMTSPVTNLTVVGTVPGKPNRLQVIIPQGLAPGQYDLHVTDSTGCPTILPAAITVTDTQTLALKSIVPPFGWDQTETPVTIFRDTASATMNAPFVATPRVFLNPSANQPAGNGCPALPTAIQVQSVSFVDMNTITAVVPSGQPTCLYDLVVVNPDKTVGVLDGAFTVQSAQPPVITSVTPSSIVNAAGQNIVVSGTGFNGSKITASCVDGMGNAVAAPAVTSGTVTCASGNCTQPATVNGSTLAAGDVCVVRITNADGSYFDDSAVGVTGSSLNTPTTHTGQALNVGRRALVAAAGNATSSARFVYAIGGDGGSAMASMPFSSTELASVDIYGNMGKWQLQPASTLGTARSFAASATLGRYIYVAGGSADGAASLSSVERAMILSPLEAPVLDIDDLVPDPTLGLDAGYWYYRVSATFTAADPDNPGGESLASDEFIVKVPSFAGNKIQVVLKWTAPAVGQIAGYNVYRTAMVNGGSTQEVLLATVPAGTLTYTDTGAATPGTQTPLPLGSTGKWATLPAMATARMGAAAAIGVDPGDPTTYYLYVGQGRTAANTLSKTYEFLPITVQANGHQTVGASWTTGTSSVTNARWQLGAFVVGSTVQSNYTGQTWIFWGGGENAAGNGQVSDFEAGKIQTGGQLAAFVSSTTTGSGVKGFTSPHAGYGLCAANQQLFVFGGANGAPSTGAESAALFGNNNPANLLPPPQMATNGWNSEGTSLVNARYLMGSTVQSAFIFLVAGDTGGGNASKTTETVIW